MIHLGDGGGGGVEERQCFLLTPRVKFYISPDVVVYELQCEVALPSTL